MLVSLKRLKEGHHAFEASMGKREEGSGEQERRERRGRYKQGEGTSWVILHKASTFL